MAARAGRARKAAGWAISLVLHLLLLGAVLLTPATKIVTPRAIEVRLAPPDFYSPLQPPPQIEAPKATRAPAAQTSPSSAPTRPRPAEAIASPILPPAAPSPAPATAPPAAAPSSQAAPPAAATRAGPSALPANGAGPGAINALRQTFGCSSGMRQILTVKEQADCERRAAERTQDLPDRSGDRIPKYKRDYYDAVVAAQNSPNHIPGTNCVYNPQVEPNGLLNKSGRPADTGVAISSNMMTCVKPPGAGPKPPPVTLKDLGLSGPPARTENK